MLTEMFSRLRDRERTGLSLAVFFLLLMVLDWIVVPRIVAECRAADRKIGAITRRLAYCRSVMDLAGGAEESYGRVVNILGRAESPEQAVADFKGRIDDIARRTGVAIQAMEHRNPVVPEDVPSGACQEYTVVIGSFEAEIGSAIRFLNEAESSPEMIRVTKFMLAPGQQIGWLKGSVELSKLMLRATE